VKGTYWLRTPPIVLLETLPGVGGRKSPFGSVALIRQLYRLRHFVGVGVPALVGLAGVVLVAASPESPCVAVRLVAAGPGDDGAAELS
jgi:hypothetical protein